MTVLFISDLHLDAGRPETLARFDEFIERRALAAREVYILGDLFEAWIGDDDDDRRLRPVIAGLQRLTEAGIPAARHARQPRFPDRQRLLRGDRLPAPYRV